MLVECAEGDLQFKDHARLNLAAGSTLKAAANKICQDLALALCHSACAVTHLILQV